MFQCFGSRSGVATDRTHPLFICWCSSLQGAKVTAIRYHVEHPAFVYDQGEAWIKDNLSNCVEMSALLAECAPSLKLQDDEVSKRLHRCDSYRGALTSLCLCLLHSVSGSLCGILRARAHFPWC